MQTSDQLEDLTKRIFQLHFSTDDHTSVTCRDCLDYKLRQCPGRDYSGIECLKCMGTHLIESHGMVLH
jgi:hypothetical protein